jgi:NitT/TauT family transport system permease protein
MSMPRPAARVQPPGAGARLLLPLLAALLTLALWAALVRLSGTRIFPGPAEVARGLGELAGKHLLWADIADSLRRVVTGFGAAALVGLPLGFVLGSSPTLFAMVNPVLEVLRPISPIAWIPVAILVFGIGDHAATALIFLAAVFPITVAAVSGVQGVPLVYRRVGRNFGVGRMETFVRVTLPAALPPVLTGLRIALGISWLVVVAAEMVAVNSGLGYLVIDSRNAGKRYDLVLAAMLVIGLIGLALDGLLNLVETRAARRLGAVRHA